MAKVLLKKSSVSTNAPNTGDLDYGEVAINYADGRLYYKNSSNVIKNFIDSDLIQTALQNAVARTLVIYEYLADSAQTVFTGLDANSATLAYTQDNIIVSLNGVVLRPGDDYTATNGTSITLAGAATLNDVFQVTAFDTFNIADTVSASLGGTFYGSISAPSFTGAATGLTGITSSNFASTQSLTIYDASGTPLKTLYGTST